MFKNILRTFMAEILKNKENIQPSAVLSPTDAIVYANLGRLDHQFFSANLKKSVTQKGASIYGLKSFYITINFFLLLNLTSSCDTGKMQQNYTRPFPLHLPLPTFKLLHRPLAILYVWRMELGRCLYAA